MRRWINWLGLVMVTLACLAPVAPARAHAAVQPQRVLSQELAQRVRDRYIVTLKSGTFSTALLKTENIAAPFVYTKALNGFAARLLGQKNRVVEGERLRRDRELPGLGQLQADQAHDERDEQDKVASLEQATAWPNTLDR